MVEFNFNNELTAALPRLHRAALAMARNRAAAEDLVQEVAVKALAAQETFTPGTNFGAWVHTILRNHFISSLRAKRTFVDIDDISPERLSRPSHQTEQLEGLELIRFIERLPAAMREALLAVALNEISYLDLSAQTGIPEGTLKTRVHRARNLLLKLINGEKPRNGVESGDDGAPIQVLLDFINSAGDIDKVNTRPSVIVEERAAKDPASLGLNINPPIHQTSGNAVGAMALAIAEGEDISAFDALPEPQVDLSDPAGRNDETIAIAPPVDILNGPSNNVISSASLLREPQHNVESIVEPKLEVDGMDIMTGFPNVNDNPEAFSEPHATGNGNGEEKNVTFSQMLTAGVTGDEGRGTEAPTVVEVSPVALAMLTASTELLRMPASTHAKLFDNIKEVMGNIPPEIGVLLHQALSEVLGTAPLIPFWKPPQSPPSEPGAAQASNLRDAGVAKANASGTQGWLGKALTEYPAFASGRNAEPLAILHKKGIETRSQLYRALVTQFALKHLDVSDHAVELRLTRLLRLKSFIGLPKALAELVNEFSKLPVQTGEAVTASAPQSAPEKDGRASSSPIKLRRSGKESKLLTEYPFFAEGHNAELLSLLSDKGYVRRAPLANALFSLFEARNVKQSTFYMRIHLLLKAKVNSKDLSPTLQEVVDAIDELPILTSATAGREHVGINVVDGAGGKDEPLFLPDTEPTSEGMALLDQLEQQVSNGTFFGDDTPDANEKYSSDDNFDVGSLSADQEQAGNVEEIGEAGSGDVEHKGAGMPPVTSADVSDGSLGGVERQASGKTRDSVLPHMPDSEFVGQEPRVAHDPDQQLVCELARNFALIGKSLLERGISSASQIWGMVPEEYQGVFERFTAAVRDVVENGAYKPDNPKQLKLGAILINMALGYTGDPSLVWGASASVTTIPIAITNPLRGLMSEFYVKLLPENRTQQRIDPAQVTAPMIESALKDVKFPGFTEAEKAQRVADFMKLYRARSVDILINDDFNIHVAEIIDLFDIPSVRFLEAYPRLKTSFLYTDLVREQFPNLANLMRRDHVMMLAAMNRAIVNRAAMRMNRREEELLVMEAVQIAAPDFVDLHNPQGEVAQILGNAFSLHPQDIFADRIMPYGRRTHSNPLGMRPGKRLIIAKNLG